MSQDSSGFSNFFEVDANGNMFTNQNAGLHMFGGKGAILDMCNENNQIKAYNQCPPFKSIVAKRSKAFNNGEIEVVDKKSKEVISNAQITAILDKLENPNPLQTKGQFLAQQNTYLDIFGWCPVIITRPMGMNNKITNIWNFPVWMLDIEYTNSWLYQTSLDGIYANFKLKLTTGGYIDIDSNSLKILFDDGFGTDLDINFLIPDSRLVGLDFPISNIIAAYKGLNTLITKKGMIGILSNQAKDAAGHVPMRNGQKKELQDEFKRYGITGQEWQVLISEANLNWQSMSYPIKDLLLYEAIQDGTMSLCDRYGYPYRLMAAEKSASYNDVKEFRKDFYQDTVIPESDSRWEQRSRAFFGVDATWRFDVTFKHVAALQEDKQASATARKTLDDACEKEFKNNAITLNMWLIDLGKDPRTDGFGDKYYYELLQEGWEFGNTTLNGGNTLPVNGTDPNAVVN